jgi:hypothetical protein
LIEDQLARWQAADLVDAATADRIRSFEAAREATAGRFRWPVILALAAGGLMLAAGALLFVAAHWTELSPGGRLILLFGTVVAFHLGGAGAAPRFAALGSTLHAVGTAALGGLIFLAGQTFHLETSWPQGFLLWAVGAWAGWLLLRDWPQALYAALLTPVWLVAEWADRAQGFGHVVPAVPMAGLLLLALAYLQAPVKQVVQTTPARTTLAVIGAVALLPLAITFRLVLGESGPWNQEATSAAFRITGWAMAFGLPLLIAWLLRGTAAWPTAVGAVWVLTGVLLGRHPGAAVFLWGGLGAAGVAASGVHEGSRLRINLGLAGFALTVLLFYFSSVMDRLGRSASLLAGGALFLVIGWGIERVRRRLVARIEESAP